MNYPLRLATTVAIVAATYALTYAMSLLLPTHWIANGISLALILTATAVASWQFPRIGICLRAIELTVALGLAFALVFATPNFVNWPAEAWCLTFLFVFGYVQSSRFVPGSPFEDRPRK